VTAKASMDTYTINLGDFEQFNGMTIYWNAIVPDGMKKFLPTYEIVDGEGQWIGTISFDDSFNVRYLPFEAMTESTPRDADAPWTTEIPGSVKQAVDAFLETAKYQVEVALAIR
jgi:hypothetical protein